MLSARMKEFRVSDWPSLFLMFVYWYFFSRCYVYRESSYLCHLPWTMYWYRLAMYLVKRRSVFLVDLSIVLNLMFNYRNKMLWMLCFSNCTLFSAMLHIHLRSCNLMDHHSAVCLCAVLWMNQMKIKSLFVELHLNCIY